MIKLHIVFGIVENRNCTFYNAAGIDHFMMLLMEGGKRVGEVHDGDRPSP